MDITPNTQLMFEKVRELCRLNGQAIYEIGKSCNIPCHLVAKFYMEMMEKLVKDTEDEIMGES